jgi:hypothetical protein
MSNETLNVDDPRSLIFTIDRQRDPLYQVESHHWARAEHRWNHSDIPPEIHAKVAELAQNGKPGAFVRFGNGEDGVYVIYESNIKPLPEAADQDVVLTPPAPASSGRKLCTYDIVIYAKGGAVRSDNGGDAYQTSEGEFYVIPCNAWGRFVLHQAMRPRDVETTKDILILLDSLHGKNFLSMTPDKALETLPPDMVMPTEAIVACNCYVLNLARFKR